MGIALSLSALVAELQPDLAAGLDDAGCLVVVLPGSGDRLVVKPSAVRTARPQLMWERRTFLNTATGARGYIDWTSEAAPLVAFVHQHAFSLAEVALQFRLVTDTLHLHGLTSRVVAADGGGFQIRVELPRPWRRTWAARPTSFLLIGAPKVLPLRTERVRGWRVEHRSPEDILGVVYDSIPGDSEKSDWRNPSPTLLAEHLATFVAQLS